MKKNKEVPAIRARDSRMLFFTIDSRVFMDMASAEKHAVTLEDSCITTMTKAAAESITETLEPNEDELERMLDGLVNTL